MYFPYRDLYTGLIKNWSILLKKKTIIQSCIFEELSSSCLSKHSLHFTERLGNYIEDYLEITKSNISSTTRWEQKPTLLIKITSGKIAKKKMCVNFLTSLYIFLLLTTTILTSYFYHLETQLDKCSFEIIYILLDTYISTLILRAHQRYAYIHLYLKQLSLSRSKQFPIFSSSPQELYKRLGPKAQSAAAQFPDPTLVKEKTELLQSLSGEMAGLRDTHQSIDPLSNLQRKHLYTSFKMFPPPVSVF